MKIHFQRCSGYFSEGVNSNGAMLASREGLGVATTEFEMKERRRIQAWIHDQSMSERKVMIVGEDWIRQGVDGRIGM